MAIGRTRRSPRGERSTAAHRLTEFTSEFAHGGLPLSASPGVEASVERLEHVVVVIVGSEVGEEIEACSDEDLLEPFKARIPFAVFDGADGAARCSCSLGQLYLSKSGQLTGLHHECGREGRHSPTDAGILLVIASNVTEIGMDSSHISSVPDPRHKVPGASY